MGQFMGDHIQRAGEALEYLPIAVAEDHLRAIPEGVFVALAVMHTADQRQTFVVDRVAPQHFPEEVIGGAQRIVGFIDCRIARGRLTFQAHRHSRQEHLVLRIVHAALDHARFSGQRQNRPLRWPRRWAGIGQQALYVTQGGHRRRALRL
ncbi:hypothetical protein D3C87_1621380 [compost metagenome]